MIDQSLNPFPKDAINITAKADTTIAYTDGACKGNPGKGGWGVLLVLANGEQRQYYGGDDPTTNNRMEMMAAIKAIKLSPADHDIELWTDSSYLKQGITTWIHSWKKKGWKKADGKPVLNQDLWQQLDALCISSGQDSKRHIHWHWVKGHAGHTGNEMADKLANLGVQYPKGNHNSSDHLTGMDSTTKQTAHTPTEIATTAQEDGNNKKTPTDNDVKKKPKTIWLTNVKRTQPTKPTSSTT